VGACANATEVAVTAISATTSTTNAATVRLKLSEFIRTSLPYIQWVHVISPSPPTGKLRGILAARLDPGEAMAVSCQVAEHVPVPSPLPVNTQQDVCRRSLVDNEVLGC
jgi:hypothetical protein